MLKNSRVLVYFSNTDNPYDNLAIEEVLAKKHNSTNTVILFFWQNANTLVVGRNQNIYQEVYLDRARQDKVKIVRRLSGGGTVYQDLGNFCYTFIVDKKNPHSYQELIFPIVKTLNRLGVNAQFSGKNDIKVGDKKISGNCQYVTENSLVHHGTVLFDVDFRLMQKYLKPNPTKYLSKGIKSNQSPVMNIKPLFCNEKFTIQKLWSEILNDLKNDHSIKILSLSPKQLSLAKQLSFKKYQNQEWTFGKNPEFNYEKKIWWPKKGFFHLLLTVKQNVIEDIHLFGDFLGYQGTEGFCRQLIGTPYQKKAINEKLSNWKLTDIFCKNVTPSDLLSLFFDY